MARIHLTSKRQATLPRKLCEEMRLQAGDSIVVDAHVVEGERVWVLKRADRIQTPWFARLRRYARRKRHDLASIRRSVEKARRDGRI
jgi:bifunctional DNA-binding transcriptional regulator/antitoxin component of YhaV-PrlF toxin-antitoxin module